MDKLIKQNGEYQNIEFKEMDFGDKVKVKPTKVLKTGESKYGTWRLFAYEVDGKEVSGFPPTGFIGEDFEKDMGETFLIERVFDKKKNKAIFIKTKLVSLNDKETQAVGILKEKNSSEEDWIATLKDGAGCTEERAGVIYAQYK